MSSSLTRKKSRGIVLFYVLPPMHSSSNRYVLTGKVDLVCFLGFLEIMWKWLTFLDSWVSKLHAGFTFFADKRTRTLREREDFRRSREAKRGSSSRVNMINNTLSIKYFPSDGYPTVNNEKALNAQGDIADSSTLDWNAYYSPENSATWPAIGQIGSSLRRSDFLMRKSCDFCGIRKRRCDGRGKRTCR